MEHEPYIFSDRVRQEAAKTHEELAPTADAATVAAALAKVEQAELRGDKSALGFWKQDTTCVFDIRITDAGSRSNRTRDPVKVLRGQEKEKKK